MSALETVGIVPVVTLDDAAVAPELAAALIAGGIRCAEITLRTAAGAEAIALVAGAQPGFLVGAGTVVTPEQVDKVADAGARFVVSPGLDAEIVERARARGLEVFPGTATATEVQHAARLGLNRVKFFPAQHLGGLGAIESLGAAFPGMRFMPSGGVDVANAAEYLASASVFAVSGSWMVPRDLVAARNWAGVERLCAEAVRAVGAVS